MKFVPALSSGTIGGDQLTASSQDLKLFPPAQVTVWPVWAAAAGVSKDSAAVKQAREANLWRREQRLGFMRMAGFRPRQGCLSRVCVSSL